MKETTIMQKGLKEKREAAYRLFTTQVMKQQCENKKTGVVSKHRYDKINRSFNNN